MLDREAPLQNVAAWRITKYTVFLDVLCTSWRKGGNGCVKPLKHKFTTAARDGPCVSSTEPRKPYFRLNLKFPSYVACVCDYVHVLSCFALLKKTLEASHSWMLVFWTLVFFFIIFPSRIDASLEKRWSLVLALNPAVGRDPSFFLKTIQAADGIPASTCDMIILWRLWCCQKQKKKWLP